MTWTKLGAEFWDDCANAGLSDAAARTHAEAIGWVYRIERSDLHIPKHLVRRFAGSPQWEGAARDLVAAGFWQDSGDAYVVAHHADVIRASITAQRRKRDRDKRSQRAWRERNGTPEVSGDVSADVSGDADSQTDSQEAKATTDDTNNWPDARQPGSGLPDDSWQSLACGYDR